MAALLLGFVSLAAGWRWALLLVLYFIGAVALSKFGARTKEQRVGGVVEKGGHRDAAQVFANGGIFGILAIAYVALPSPLWLWGALASLSASSADTWATEIGTLYGGVPRSILNRTNVRIGMSGGVTFAGTLGGIAGALYVALLGALLGWPNGAALACLAGGVAGMLADSLVGATLQEQRWCDRCNEPTERHEHQCGAMTRHTSGVRWIRNDFVNLTATAVGACVGMIGAVWLG